MINCSYRLHNKFHVSLPQQTSCLLVKQIQSSKFTKHTKGSSILVGFFCVKFLPHNLDCSFSYQTSPQLPVLVNFSFPSYTPPSCTCRTGSFPSHLTHRHSSNILCHTDGGVAHLVFLLHTTLRTYHFISLICHSHDFLHTYKTINTKLLACFVLLITTLSFLFSLHMPLITTFLSGPWLCWSLSTILSLVQWVGKQFGRKILLG